MKRLSVEFAKGSLAALAVLLTACTPAVFARSDRGSVAAIPEQHDRPNETAAEPTPYADSDAKLSEPRRESAPDADVQRAVKAPASERSAGESQTESKQDSAQASAPVAASVPNVELPELFRLERGTGEVTLVLPRDETLVYEVHLNLGWLGSPDVGKVTLSCAVRPFYSDKRGSLAGEQALLSGRAEGSYKVYTLDNIISATLLPQPWPRLVHRNVQTGTENRTRELWFGVQDGKEVSRYRADGHCKGCSDKKHFVSGTWPWQKDEHCKKCKRLEHRVWKDPKLREVPAGTFDMLTAVYLARSMVIDGRERMEFPLVDRSELWRLQLTRGKSKQIETSAGKFDCVAIELRTSAPEAPAGGETTKFEGLFGIHGTISIWMEAGSGVPVRIDGVVPAGPIELDATIELHSARGTPRSFTTLH